MTGVDPQNMGVSKLARSVTFALERRSCSDAGKEIVRKNLDRDVGT
jgi:hypothetical protein